MNLHDAIIKAIEECKATKRYGKNINKRGLHVCVCVDNKKMDEYVPAEERRLVFYYLNDKVNVLNGMDYPREFTIDELTRTDWSYDEYKIDQSLIGIPRGVDYVGED